jgi:hypothetical protein
MNFHDLDRRFRNSEMRVPHERFCRGILGLGRHNRVEHHVVPAVGDTLRGDALGLADTRAWVGEQLRMAAHPGLPSCIIFSSASFFFAGSVFFHSSRTRAGARYNTR